MRAVLVVDVPEGERRVVGVAVGQRARDPAAAGGSRASWGRTTRAPPMPSTCPSTVTGSDVRVRAREPGRRGRGRRCEVDQDAGVVQQLEHAVQPAEVVPALGGSSSAQEKTPTLTIETPASRMSRTSSTQTPPATARGCSRPRRRARAAAGPARQPRAGGGRAGTDCDRLSSGSCPPVSGHSNERSAISQCSRLTNGRTCLVCERSQPTASRGSPTHDRRGSARREENEHGTDGSASSLVAALTYPARRLRGLDSDSDQPSTPAIPAASPVELTFWSWAP